MHHFQYRDGEMFAEEIPVRELAEQFGTPLYVYSHATFRRHFEAFDSAFEGLDHMTCYSAKANSNLCVLKMLAGMGAGVDIVSGGELCRALAVGIPAEKIVFSGVGKRPNEIREALDADILMFNVESMGELEVINEIAAAAGKPARVSLRINPDVDPKTHPYVATGLKKSKFGLDMETSLEGYRLANKMENIRPIGIDCHIGSQLTQIDPFLDALDKILAFRTKLMDLGLSIDYLDLGGGLGIQYESEEPPHPKELGRALTERLKGLDLKVILEPGRVIAGNSGILVTRVLYAKDTPSRHFVIVDAAMNDLVRPSLYDSYHRILEVRQNEREEITADVVGPICESGDFLARDRPMPRVERDELLAVLSAGAYGFVMSSQYNSRPRAAEVLVKGDSAVLARKRESYEDLLAHERDCLDLSL
jgi:diaminopimelate decarboxylase